MDFTWDSSVKRYEERQALYEQINENNWERVVSRIRNRGENG
jgi:hypothetical protein